MNKIILAVIAVVVLAVIAVSLFGYRTAYIPMSQTETPQEQPMQTPPSQPSVKEFTLLIDHSSGYSFTPNDGDPNRIRVNVGDVIKILASSNQPSHNHGITVDVFDMDVTVVSPQTTQFTANQAGSFQIYCKTCLDGPLGAHPWMTGTLIVE